MFTVGTGVGGGIVLNGKLYRGATGAAAEIGHTIIGLDLSDGDAAADGAFPQAARSRRWPPAARSTGSPTAARDDADSFLGKRLTRDGGVTGHDVVDGAREGDERVAPLPADPRRAARHRHRQRDQHVRPAGGRDRRRRVGGRRAAARARRARPPAATSCRASGTEDRDPPRPPRAARRRARRGADRRPGVRRGTGERRSELGEA